jgi:hypothetical protein
LKNFQLLLRVLLSELGFMTMIPGMELLCKNTSVIMDFKPGSLINVLTLGYSQRDSSERLVKLKNLQLLPRVLLSELGFMTKIPGMELLCKNTSVILVIKPSSLSNALTLWYS